MDLTPVERSVKSLAVAFGANSFLGRLLGPSTAEAGLLLADNFKVPRLKKQIRVLEKAKKLLSDAKIKPARVNLKLLAPLLEACDLEDDESMADRYAALLANAASSSEDTFKQSLFPKLLEQISPMEARILEWFAERPHDVISNDLTAIAFGNDGNGCWRGSLSGEEFWISYDNLRRLGLLEENKPEPPYDKFRHSGRKEIQITHLGKALLRACRFPCPQETVQKSKSKVQTATA